MNAQQINERIDELREEQDIGNVRRYFEIDQEINELLALLRQQQGGQWTSPMPEDGVFIDWEKYDDE